jgi:hypothetical protein
MWKSPPSLSRFARSVALVCSTGETSERGSFSLVAAWSNGQTNTPWGAGHTIMVCADLRECRHNRIRLWEDTAWDVDRESQTADIGEEEWDNNPICLDCHTDISSKEFQEAVDIVERQRGNL